MGNSSDSSTTSYEQQLSALERRLHAQIDDETTVQDLHSAIKTLLSNGHDAETDIRAVLKRRFTAGQMREETYQLVQQILDRIVTEDVATFPDAPAAATDDDDAFSDTTVLPGDAFSPEPDEGRLQVGSVIRDRFLLQEKIAGGSMGVVYKALDRRLAEADGVNPYVAIKVLSPKLARNGNALRALQQEAAKGRCLSHANIVRFIDLDRDDDLYFIVMEWLDGRSLADMLDDKRGARIDKATALDIVRQTGAALDYAHRCGVIHADVKPGNIMITPAGQVKLFDFGVARVRQKQQVGQPGLDSAVLNARTPAYSSMQVLTGEDPVPADDVFSLGCLLYRLLAGYRVFGPRNAAEAAEAGMEPQRLADLSHAEWAALRKSLAYARVARFATVSEFLKALEGQAKAEYPAEADADDEAAPEGGRSRRKVLLPAAVLLVAGLAAYHFAPLDRLAGLLSGDAGTVPLRADEEAAPATVDGEGTEAAAAPDPMSDKSAAARPPGVDAPLAAVPEIAVAPDALPPGAGPPPALPDFDSLPAPDLRIRLAVPGSTVAQQELVMMEDDGPVVVDFVRDRDVAMPLTLRLVEVSFSGNWSPWESGQYTIENNGLLEFAAGQSRARLSLSMSSDPLREPDREAVLLLRDVDNPASEFARLGLTLQDDDQRRFEAGLLPNTVGFANSQVSVRESDPAAQIDVLRFKPDNSELHVDYVVRDVTAVEGEDYFAPAAGTISFGPGQRTARIFIPLVQDAVAESDEAFMLELDPQVRADDSNIFLRIAVMIRDDDSRAGGP